MWIHGGAYHAGWSFEKEFDGEAWAQRDVILSEQPTYVYYFDAAPPTDGRPALTGSFHSSELWSVFHTQDRSWRPFTEADHELSDRIVDYWTNFVKYANPNGLDEGEWHPCSQSDPYVQKLTRK